MVPHSIRSTAEAAVEPPRHVDFANGEASPTGGHRRGRRASAARAVRVWKDEIVAWFRTLVSAAVYATLIVTFGFQVARVEGQSMAPTLDDQDRLIVNKLAYRLGPPRRGDIVMLYYPRRSGQVVRQAGHRRRG